jgi:hypothetical protein
MTTVQQRQCFRVAARSSHLQARSRSERVRPFGASVGQILRKPRCSLLKDGLLRSPRTQSTIREGLDVPSGNPIRKVPQAASMPRAPKECERHPVHQVVATSSVRRSSTTGSYDGSEPSRGVSIGLGNHGRRTIGVFDDGGKRGTRSRILLIVITRPVSVPALS